MKTIISKIRNFKFSLLLILVSNSTWAVTPTYCLRVENIALISPDAYEFDIYLMHTNPDSTNFEFALGQYYFNFNPLISSSVLTYSIVGSDLLLAAQPRNPHVGIMGGVSVLFLNSNSALGIGNGPAISSVYPGTKIVRMRLSTADGTPFNSAESLSLEWRTELPNPFAKIFAYTGGLNTEITTQSTHSIGSECLLPTEEEEEEEGIDNETLVGEIVDNSLMVNWSNDAVYYSLGQNGVVTVSIYDIAGNLVKNIVNVYENEGRHLALFDTQSLSSGMYVCSLTVQTNNGYQRVSVKKAVVN